MKKYKNTFRFSVAHAIKKNFILPLATFVLSMIFYLTGFCWDVLSEAKNKAAITGQNVMKLMREAYEVFIFDSERAAYEPLISFYPALLVVISLLVGVLLFRFVTNKKTVNVYYSLGIKRADLYTARLVAGIIMMLAATLIPLAVSLGINLHFFGSSVMLWRTFLFYAVHNVICVLAGLTISAAVSSCVGTVVESLGFSAVLAAFPSVVTMCVNYSVPAILNGAPSKTYYDIYPVASSFGENYLDMTNSTLFGRAIAHINLLMLNRSSFINSSSIEAMTKEAAKKWAAPSLTPYILWAVLIAAFFVFGLFMFKRRKAEICGFPGRSAVLNFVLCMIASFGAASLIIYFIAYTSQISRWIMIALVIVAAFLVFVILDVILHLSFKALKKDWKIGLVHVGLMAAFLLSLYTGFFGYSSRVPDTDSIESASVSAPDILLGSYRTRADELKFNANSGYYLAFDEDGNPVGINSGCYYRSNADERRIIIDGFKSESDINAVRELHKRLIASGRKVVSSSEDYSERAVRSTVIIKYKLKNGREIIREYQTVRLGDYLSLYSIENTENWNNKIKNELLNINSEKVFPVLFSGQMDKKTVVDQKFTRGLARAIYEDITALGADRILCSDSKWLGAAALYRDGIKAEMEAVTQIYSPDTVNGDTETPEDAIRKAWKTGNYGEMMTNGSEYGDFGKFKSVIPITEEMTNTVKYLKVHGLYDLLVDESPIVAVRVADIGKLTVDALEYTTPIFNAFWDNGKSKPETDRETGEQISTYTSGDYMPKNSREFTDGATINALAENAYGYRFDLTGGYVAEFRRANGCRTIMYIPKGRVELNLG